MLRFWFFFSEEERFTSDEFGIDQESDLSVFSSLTRCFWNPFFQKINATSGGYRKKTKVAFCSLTNKLKAAQITRSVSAQNLSVRSLPSEKGKEFQKESCNDTQADMLLGIPKSASCVQRLDDSLISAIHITYRSLLRSSSMHEPRDPPLKVVFSFLICYSLAYHLLKVQKGFKMKGKVPHHSFTCVGL